MKTGFTPETNVDKFLKLYAEGKRDFQNINLKQAYLAETELRGVNLRGANLRKADLSEADLEGANLQEANLQGAELIGTELRMANLQGVNLRQAELSGVKGVEYGKYERGKPTECGLGQGKLGED